MGQSQREEALEFLKEELRENSSVMKVRQRQKQSFLSLNQVQMQPFESLPETRNLLDRSERSIEKMKQVGERTSSFQISKPELTEKLPLAQTNFLGSQPGIQRPEDSKAGRIDH